MNDENFGKVLFAAIVFMVIVGFATIVIMRDVERRECENWQGLKSIAEWQKQQCENYNLPLTGQVRPETIR